MAARTPIIALLTDFGLRDTYVGQMKGVIAKTCPSANVIDVTHDLPAHDIAVAAFVLKNVLAAFPAGAIFCAVVDPGVGTNRGVLCAFAGDHAFIAPDNGVLSPILRENAVNSHSSSPRVFSCHPCAESSRSAHRMSRTFHGRDVFAPLAARLTAGADPADLGSPTTDFIRLTLPAPLQQAEHIEGEVILVDHFGNCVTNITSDMLADLGAPDQLTIAAGGAAIAGLSATYADARAGDPLALVSSFDTLEIACNQASAAQSLGIARGARITVTRTSVEH